MNLEQLPIQEGLKAGFIQHLEDMNVYKMYTSMFANLNRTYKIISLSAYTSQDYLNKDRLLELYNILKLKGTTYNQLYIQVLEYSKKENLTELKRLLPSLNVDILELIYTTPENITRLITQQVTELQSYEPDMQIQITEETIRVYLELAKNNIIFSSNFTKLYEDNKILFNPSLGQYMNIEVAKRVVYLQKTIHQIRGTRICIIDTETTGFTKPKPIQISFLLFDMNFNLIKSYNRYVRQDYIEQGATVNSHGITVQMLNNVLPAIEPEEAYEEIRSLLEDEKVIFLAHNANYDVRVLNNLAIQCTGKALSPLKYLCTYRDYSKFSNIILKDHTLSTLLSSNHITIENVKAESHKLFQINSSTLKYHNAIVDTTALYLFVQKSKFFTNI